MLERTKVWASIGPVSTNVVPAGIFFIQSTIHLPESRSKVFHSPTFANSYGKKHYILPNVPIHGIADRGKGVGRSEDGITVFVEGAVPGDTADVFVQKKEKKDSPRAWPTAS